jgi:pyruvate, water dikinase
MLPIPTTTAVRSAIRHFLFCCVIFGAAFFARADDALNLTISFDARHRARVTWQGSDTHYYQLYRSDQPGTPGEPVAMRLGGAGMLELVDTLPALQRAFYRVRLIPIEAALDTDGDGINDPAELGALPLANPLNAAESIGASDGAIYVPDEAAFSAISHRDNFPGAANVREVKFLIMNVDGSKPELYFLNANQHVYHYYFAALALGYPYSLSTFNSETYFTNSGRRNLAGSLIVHENYTPPGGGPPGIITMEFWPSDPVAYRFVQLAYDMITRALPWVETRIAYHAASQTQRTLYQSERALYDAARQFRLHVITTEELFGQVSYSLLNPGVAFGRLVLADASTTLTARDIPVFRVLPNDLTHVAGVITSVVQTPLSHVNLKAKQNNLPNAYVKSAETHPQIAPLLGKYVRYETLADGFTLREATQAEVDQHIESLRPPNPQFPVRNLTATTIQPLAALGFSSSSSYGAKAANVAEMRKFLPAAMVPDGYAIPYYFYDEFMKANGLYASAQTMMASPQFTNDAAYRASALLGFRNLIKASPMPSWMTNALSTLQSGFPVGTGIRCRSSANAEDLTNFNGAGLYDSFTHRADEGHLSKTVKQVWASLWNLRAWDEREFFRVDHLTSVMGVLVHPNFDDELSNGVAVTKNIIDPNWVGYYVNAQLGESLVTNPDPNAVPEEFLIAELIGVTRYEIQYVTFSSLLPAGQTVMTRAHAEQLADTMRLIQSRFKTLYQGGTTFAMEIEFKVDAANQLVVKQARPFAE